MALLHNNIDINDAAYNTNAPFDYACQLSLGSSMSLPHGSFLSIKIYCDESIAPPVRLSYITATSSSVDIAFSDGSNKAVGTATVLYSDVSSASDPYCAFVSSFIRNDIGDITGHLAMAPDAIGALYMAAHKAGGTYSTAVSDFVLLPQCIYPMHRPSTRAISIAGTLSRSNICIKPDSYVLTDVVEGEDTKKRVMISLAGPVKDATPIGSPRILRISGYSDSIGSYFYYTGLFNVNLHILSDKYSNLRVVNTNNGIELKGVLDV